MGNATYTLGDAPTLLINNCSGDLHIEGRAGDTVLLRSDSMPSSSQAAGQLIIEDCEDDLHIQAPPGASLRIERLEGDLFAHQLSALRAGTVSGDADVRSVRDECSVRHVEGDLRARDVGALSVDKVEGDADLQGMGDRCEVGRVEGDVRVREAATLSLELVSGDLDVAAVGGCAVRQVEGDVRAREVAELTLGGVAGDLDLDRVAGRLGLGRVEGDARLRGALRGLDDVRIEGDLALETGFLPGEAYELEVGGDASVSIPQGADLYLDAWVEGDVAGAGLRREDDDPSVRAVWGSGATRLKLRVGGDLSLRGPDARISGASGFSAPAPPAPRAGAALEGSRRPSGSGERGRRSRTRR
jgi:hypothetical protein